MLQMLVANAGGAQRAVEQGVPVQVARDPGINPATYLHPALGAYSHTISNLDPTPLFLFGHGRRRG